LNEKQAPRFAPDDNVKLNQMRARQAQEKAAASCRTPRNGEVPQHLHSGLRATLLTRARHAVPYDYKTKGAHLKVPLQNQRQLRRQSGDMSDATSREERSLAALGMTD
jgi:hypothetical protein